MFVDSVFKWWFSTLWKTLNKIVNNYWFCCLRNRFVLTFTDDPSILGIHSHYLCSIEPNPYPLYQFLLSCHSLVFYPNTDITVYHMTSNPTSEHLPHRHKNMNSKSHVYLCSLRHYDNSQIWKQTYCPTTDELIKKVWYINKIEYYIAIRRDEILQFSATWMEGIMLSELSQKEKSS